VQGVLYGIKPAVTAIYRIGKRALQGPLHWVIAVAALLAIAVGKIGFPYIVLCAAVVGLVAGRIKPELFSESDDHSPGSGGERHVSVIDDDTPTPEHARFNVRRLLTLSLIALGLWVLLMAALSILFGWQSTLTQMGWFFTKAALVTFGGAYAVLRTG